MNQKVKTRQSDKKCGFRRFSGGKRGKSTCGKGYIIDSPGRSGKTGANAKKEGKRIQACKVKARNRKRGWIWALGLGMLLILAAGMYRKEETGWSITNGSYTLVHYARETDPERVLFRQGIRLGTDDSYSVTRENGVPEIRIIRGKKRNHIRQQEEQYTEVLQQEVIRCADPALPKGLEIILREGTPGELRCRAWVTYTNGVETGREIIDQKVSIQPVSRLVAVGIGSMSDGDMGEPVIKDGLIYLPTGEVLTYDRVMTSLATAYCDKGLTATGTQARVGAIAVDPEVIPYGTRMFIVSKDGEYIYGLATAEDCGSKKHIYDTRIDLHFDTYAECRAFGARYCRVYFLS